MPYIETVILNCLKQLNGERTIYSIYHLLKGKKSSQTIQDAHLFGLTELFGIYPSLTREVLEAAITIIAQSEWITPCGDQRFLLTDNGKEILQSCSEQKPFPKYIQGWKFTGLDSLFWERLSLLVQVVSNLIFKESHYIPIQKNKEIHKWLKSFLKKNSLQRELLGRTLYEEITACLELADDIDPSVLVFRLTGYNKIGLTALQTAERLNIEYTRYQMEFMNVLHFLLEQVTTQPNRFPLLGSVLENIKKNRLLTNSSHKTYEMLQRGYSIAEIAKMRGLKVSTIEDHIVEIALNIHDFSIDNYIDKQVQNKILTAARKHDTKQLKTIRSSVASANYFEIRLVLAKYGVRQWN